jgi:RHS repeat-associated protein
VLTMRRSTHKFTGKQRDTESGLDDFGARYFGSSLGRFMSTDPGNSSGYDNPGDPQGWDAYSYVRNNPLNLTDPDGRDYRVCIDDGYGGKNCTTYATFRDLQTAAKASSSNLNGNDQSGQILIDGKSIGTYQYFVGPGTESLGVPDITADYFFNFPALFTGVGGVLKGIFNLGRAAGTFELTTIGSGSKLASAAAARAALRASGNVIERVVQTSAGPVSVKLIVVAEGETAVIKALDIKGSGADVGYTEIRQGFNGILSDLKQAGFKDFRMEPQYRTDGAAAKGFTGMLTGKIK